MRKQFEHSYSHDIDVMRKLIVEMSQILEMIDTGEIPNKLDYTEENLQRYCQSLVENQRGNLGRTIPGSWSVAPNDNEMDSDARVDFIFVPTYIAVATLSRVWLDFPNIATEIPGFQSALQVGLNFAASRGLRGSGIEAFDGKVYAYSILALGCVPELLQKNPQWSKDLVKEFARLDQHNMEKVFSRVAIERDLRLLTLLKRNSR